MQNNMVIFGIHAVLEAIKTGLSIDKVFLDKAAKGNLYQEIRLLLVKKRLPYSYVPTIKLNQLTPHRHQGIVALVCPVPLAQLGNVVPTIYEQSQVPLILLADGITDVGNLGAIIRTALCAGVHALVVPQQGSASLGGTALKTSAGALLHLPICRVMDLVEAIEYLKASGLQVIACHEKATCAMYQIDFTLPTALLLGAEGKGIQPRLLKLVDHACKIPMQGPVASLNVSVAAALIIYESYRQRTI